MTHQTGLEYLKERDHYITVLSNVVGVLNWDMETVMPNGAMEGRSEQFSLLASLIHEAETDEKLEEAVYAIDSSNLTDADKALVRSWKKQIRNAKATPKRLVTEMAEESAKAYQTWLEARAKDDFSIFQPSLSTLIKLSAEEASCIGDGTYDALLDKYEEGITRSDIDPLFDELERSIHSLMDKLEDVSVDTSFLTAPYEKSSLEAFCDRVMVDMGFNKERGTSGIVAHPFTINLGPDDIRVSNRFTDASLFNPICSIIHETGHALYEMTAALNPEIRGTTLSNGTSMGIHESQSRFWENIIGRSEPFWEYYYPILQVYIPSLSSVPLSDFIKSVNYSHPSAIRVNADELTYSLHVILRYRIEKALFDGSISVSEIPEVWREESKKIVRYSVKNDSEGCLQDSHWSGGSFGYFPTYALGNLYGALFLEKMESDFGGEAKINEKLRKGELKEISAWLGKNIWTYGAIYPPKELLKRVTGKTLSVEPFVNYLDKKFTSLYL